jgi:FkbM family methyltransferase
MMMRKIRTIIQIATSFSNILDYFSLLRGATSRTHITLSTRDGLKISCRNNYWDVRIVTETFLERPYLRDVTLSVPTPVVVDVGGYIGDFSLYAARYLNAKVYVYEPMPENYEVLKENVSINGYEGRIKIWNKAVSNDPEIVINIARQDNDIHASKYMYGDSAEKLTVNCSRLESVFVENGIEKIDLLKLDCEGCEYDVLGRATQDVLKKIHNIVFEYHRIPEWTEQLARVEENLKSAGFSVVNDSDMCIFSARR